MIWTEIGFGKHAAKTLPQLALADTDHFFWMCGHNDAVRRDQELWEEAQVMYHRARHILVPEGAAVAYSEHANGGFAGISLVPASGRRHPASSRSFVLPYIDLSVPRSMKAYDKLGSKLLVSQMLRSIGYGHPRLTKNFCEGFFESEENFAPIEEGMGV